MLVTRSRTADPITRFRTMPSIVASIAACAFVVATCALAGCNTTEGVGRDVEAVGEAIEDAADGD